MARFMRCHAPVGSVTDMSLLAVADLLVSTCY